jgi:hypothetical protein
MLSGIYTLKSSSSNPKNVRLKIYHHSVHSGNMMQAKQGDWKATQQSHEVRGKLRSIL